MGAGACVGYGGCPPFGLAEAIAAAAGFDVNAPFTDIIRDLAFSICGTQKRGEIPSVAITELFALTNSRYSRRTSAVTFTAFVRLRISNRTNVASTLEPSK